MTGFGSADGAVGEARVSVEIRSVNHRFFNPSVKLPSELSKWEGDVRDALRRGITRGHVTLAARVERTELDAARIDGERFGAYVEQIRHLQERFGLSGDVDAASILRLPNVIASHEDEAEGSAAELVAIVDRAVAALDQMRTAEGARLAQYLEERLSIIELAVARIAERAPTRLVAILADKLDVAEEISRFHSHFVAFRATIASPSPEGVGKRLGFLLQELLREANTTGSKANDASMLQNVIVIKEELERIREQVENLE
jgi:uncharacterized protein YicC (UPF0701 family)